MKFTQVVFILFLPLMVACGPSKGIPEAREGSPVLGERIQLSDSSFALENNHLYKNSQGLWELYVAGDPMTLGLVTGSLTQELFQRQEEIFMGQVKELVPKNSQQWFLKQFLGWYNKKMPNHIPQEYKTEIYGLSQFATDKYNNLADPYHRVMYLHGAHDIGHALQDLALVGCSSFAAWGDKTVDGKLLVGRNFDFYVGDEFAQEKIVAFVAPEEGYKFMSVTWGGMIGVVSGMNEHGLTVTINAGKSKIPLRAKTPISLVNREILQYASNLDEAIAIAKKREVFVSESIFVASAQDKRALIIEVSPDNFGVYEVPNANQLICSNHFQSDAYSEDQNNLDHIEESHSQYRYDRMEELLGKDPKLDPNDAVNILRNKEGLNGVPLGYGNEKALNQLLAHHAVVFQPEDKKVWVSTNPYQLGAFVAYDLDAIFKNETNWKKGLSTPKENIPKDPFINTKAFADYEYYRTLRRDILSAIVQDKQLSPDFLKTFWQSNPDYWEGYYLTGRYYYNKGYLKAAKIAFETAQQKEVTTFLDEQQIAGYIKKINRKLGL